MATESMRLPWKVLDACNGFSVDIGGSAMKFLYINKNDWKEPAEREKGSMGVISMKSFPHKEFQNPEAFEFIKKNVYLKKKKEGEDAPLILGTGLGVSVIGAKLNKEFGVTMQCEEESTCFGQALAYIVKHLPRQDVLYKFDPKVQEAVLRSSKSLYQTTLQMKGMIQIRTRDEESVPVEDLWFVKKDYNADLEKPLVTEENMFPCILVMCGSAFGSMLLYEDGTYDLVNETSLGGKYWTGMASLLNNAQTYDELMALVEKGDPGTVDVAQHDFMGPQMDHDKLEDGNMYQEFMDIGHVDHTRTVYSFGKVTPQNKDKMKPEDMTKAFLDGLITDTTGLAMTAARITRARHVFYTGGFVSHPLIQKLMYRQWLDSWAEFAALDKSIKPIEVHFLKHSSQLGALGALLRNLQL